jgi:molybdopterin converting factor small subunit
VATVVIPAPLREYSGGRERVEVPGGSLRRVFESLDAECPGIGSELVVDGGIRPGIAVFIDDEQTSEGLIQRVPDDATVRLLPALGGGAP